MEDKDWLELPTANVRTRTRDIQPILESLEKDGFCIAGNPRIEKLDTGLYIEIMFNIGKHGSIIAFPMDILIPFKFEQAQETPEITEETKEPANDN